MLNRVLVGTCLVLSLVGTITTKSAEATTVTWDVTLLELDDLSSPPFNDFLDIHSGAFRYDDSVVTEVPGYGEAFKLTSFSFEVNDIIYNQPQGDLIFLWDTTERIPLSVLPDDRTFFGGSSFIEQWSLELPNSERRLNLFSGYQNTEENERVWFTSDTNQSPSLIELGIWEANQIESPPTKVPEPSSTLSLIIIGILGFTSTILNRQINN